jgi:hypothetical protein
MMGEQVAALADVDGSQLAGPLIHIAKQVPMNGLKVRKIKAACEGRVGKFTGPLRYEVRLGCFKQRLFGDTKAVF